jgi:phosphomannomutase
MKDLIVSVSGIRGIFGQGLTASQAQAFASALATHVAGGPVVLSRDGRPSGLILRHAVLAGLLEGGCTVHDVGVTPTPTCGLAVRRLHAAGGIQITASHNPAEWNGLKLFGPDGAVLSAIEGLRMQRLFDTAAYRRVSWNEIGVVEECNEAQHWHCDRVLELVDGTSIGKENLKVFVDANGGAGGSLSGRLIEALGCRAVIHGGEADGRFEHPPEPLAENLRDVLPLIPRAGAVCGCVLDPDADRLALIDETGRYIGEELTLALAVLFRLGQEKGPVVINMSSSRVVEDIASRFGVPCHRSAVGEANVAEKMRAVGAVIGGEGNGGVIDPRVGYVRDPFIGMGLILNLLAGSGKSLSALVADLPAYAIIKDKVAVGRERLAGTLAALEKRWPEAQVNRLDGLRLDWQDRWIHVRPSNTEPIVRVIAEATNVDAAKNLCREAAATLTG